MSVDGRALQAPRASAITRSCSGTRLSLPLLLSHGTCDGSVPPVVEMRACPGVLLGADDSTLDQRKYQGIEEGEAEEAITRCAGPPAAALSMSAGTRHTPEEVRICSTDRSRSQVHPGGISDFCLFHGVHMFICSLVLLQVTSRRAAGLI